MSRRVHVWRWGPAVAWMAMLFTLSAQQGLRVSSDASVDGPLRHLAHVVTYAILGMLLLRALDWDAPLTRRDTALAAVLALLYGVTDELHQTTVPTRNGQPLDLVWDGLGATIGVALCLGLSWRRARGRSG